MIYLIYCRVFFAASMTNIDVIGSGPQLAQIKWLEGRSRNRGTL
jgi:hypothetical protein